MESLYSQSNASKRMSEDHDSIEVATLARQGIPISISVRTQEVTVRLDPTNMSLEELDTESIVLQEYKFDTFRVT